MEKTTAELPVFEASLWEAMASRIVTSPPKPTMWDEMTDEEIKAVCLEGMQ